MTIGVDAGCLGGSDQLVQTGVYQVAKNLLIKLGEIDKRNDYVLYSFSPIKNESMKMFGQRMKNYVIRPQKGWSLAWLPLRVFLDKPSVYLALSQSMPWTLTLYNSKTIGIIHDIAYEKFPDYYVSSLKKLRSRTKYLVKNADILLAVSESTKLDVMSIYNAASKNIVVSYPGVSNKYFINTKKYKNKSPYFLFVGSLKKIKNVPFILTGFSEFIQKAKVEVDLILAGSNKWLDDNIQKTMSEFPDSVKKHILFLDYVADDKLPLLYKGALGFVSPSLYEGFGLTILEAMASGCPVIASTAGSSPEIVGDGVEILVDPNNVKELSSVFEKIVFDSDWRKLAIEKGKQRAKLFTWERFANQVLQQINS